LAVSDAGYDGFRVARWVDALGDFIRRRPRFGIALGNLESRVIADDIDGIRVTQPIYISGVARAGSTILLEMLAQHPDLASHRYRDYPRCSRRIGGTGFWNAFRNAPPRRRSGRIETASPSRLRARRPSKRSFGWPCSRACTTRRRARCCRAEAFYRDHIRKLVRVRGGKRYLSKDNYIVSRLEYVLTLFPDARFVIPVRDPVWHIASLMKQHALFCAGEERHPEGAQTRAAGRTFRIRAGPTADQRRRRGAPGRYH
jgi:Sulfotransferase family